MLLPLLLLLEGFGVGGEGGGGVLFFCRGEIISMLLLYEHYTLHVLVPIIYVVFTAVQVTSSSHLG